MQGSRHTLYLCTLPALVLFAGCMLLGPRNHADSETIAGGDSFGECIGYCSSVIRVTEDYVVFEASGWDFDSVLPVLADSTETDPALWSYLRRLSNQLALVSLQPVYGCPDCADGGAEWLDLASISTDDGRVTYEYGNPPASMRALTDTLRSIRISWRRALVEDGGGG